MVYVRHDVDEMEYTLVFSLTGSEIRRLIDHLKIKGSSLNDPNAKTANHFLTILRAHES
jgi:hypothetical protein